ncbi:MAG: glycosyltransferase family 2 protein [Rubrivivax sp.]|nr:glycosyltransferase family 2 protein [Rubrivivax sp.]
MIEPCVVIPVYNHPESIAAVVTQVRQRGLPCFVIDDGSDEPCRSILDAIAAGDDGVRLLRLEQNRGKGAAVCAGLAAAAAAGFSHALQVDADAQHNLGDLATFIQRASDHPEAVVTGDRIYGEVPASRRYGRMLTDALVWLQTLSLQISDSMCGYRVYPLAATMALLRDHTVGQRMDFDTDILVRLYWRGVPVEQVATPVVYRSDIPSHFDLVRDNARITRMHLRLLLGMLVRLPHLLRAKWQRARQHAPG